MLNYIKEFVSLKKNIKLNYVKGNQVINEQENFR
jgi:hypothetical protein